MKVTFGDQLNEHQVMMSALNGLSSDLDNIAGRVANALRCGHTVYWFGNGGSAAQAQHLATELVVRYEREREALASVALTTDTSLLTAESNDHGFDTIFSRQIEALCRPGDVAIGLSTSGNSSNVCRALAVAKARGAVAIALTGSAGGQVAEIADAALQVPSGRTSRIQEAHLFLGHLLCSHIEAAFSKTE